MNDNINHFIQASLSSLHQLNLPDHNQLDANELEVKIHGIFAHFIKIIEEHPQSLPEETRTKIYSRLNMDVLNDSLPSTAKIESLTHALKDFQAASLESLAAPQPVVQEPELPAPGLDTDFICDSNTYRENAAFIKTQLNDLAEFDTRAFLMGPKLRDPLVSARIDTLLEKTVVDVRQKAKEISTIRGISIEKAYKLIIGLIDKCDEHAIAAYQADKRLPPASSFALRSAILLASQKDGANLESWMTYTKGGKPTDQAIWTFVDHWKNWVPEAQGAMAKLSESMIVKATNLADKHQEGKVILLKGGYGAGKTRLTGQLLNDLSDSAMAPDVGKKVVRRSMESVTHAASHVQGSQLAYRLFFDMIKNLAGTVVYDSSLRYPKDIEQYLEKVKAYNQTKAVDQPSRKLIIYDVARNDMARALSVLKRSVTGEDPRVPPNVFIHAAVAEKLNRLKCMQVILQDQERKENEVSEYHFIGGNQQGWDTQEMMVLSSNNKLSLTSELAKERLALEGIQLDKEQNTVHSALNEATLKQDFDNQFNRPVIEILKELSPEEQATLQEVFANRTFEIAPLSPIDTPNALYHSLPERMQSAISPNAFQDAFTDLDADVKNAFFASIEGKASFNYLDLPLRAAFIIHQNLQHDPWV